METVDNPRPTCGCCRQRLHTAWIAWSPDGLVTCGAETCAGWARSRGLTLYSRGLMAIRKGPVRPRGKPRCDYCGGERPPLRDCFRNDDGQVFCSLTCRARAARVGMARS